jgi:hypothetical protein
LGYFTERLDPGPTRQALLSLIRGAKRNKAFDDCRWIGLAIDGTGAGSHEAANGAITLACLGLNRIDVVKSPCDQSSGAAATSTG